MCTGGWLRRREINSHPFQPCMVSQIESRPTGLSRTCSQNKALLAANICSAFVPKSVNPPEGRHRQLLLLLAEDPGRLETPVQTQGEWSASDCSARARGEVQVQELLILVEKLTQNWKQMHLQWRGEMWLLLQCVIALFKLVWNNLRA